MCYKTSTPNKDQLEGYFQKEEVKQDTLFTVTDYPQYYHADGFTMPFLPFTAAEEPATVKPAMWKLIPHWVKSWDEAKKYANTLNATSEEIFEKASYKHYISKNRGLLWVKGFFEANHPNAKTTVPYFIYAANGDPFTLGCLYSNWLNQETGEVITTFSIITTRANELMSEIHNTKKRMPLIIPTSNRKAWLGKLTTPEITDLMTPLPDGFLAAHPISNNLYKKGIDTNTPEILERVA